MSEEEKKAIEKIKKILYMFPESEELKLILNLIEKQQKEIQRLEARRYMYNAETGEISQIPLNNNYISKDKLIELREIDNIDLMQCKLRKILEE